jgi:hypothetical protein
LYGLPGCQLIGRERSGEDRGLLFGPRPASIYGYLSHLQKNAAIFVMLGSGSGGLKILDGFRVLYSNGSYTQYAADSDTGRGQSIAVLVTYAAHVTLR